MQEARFWTGEGERVRCHLCPHSCLIASRKRGICGVRENREGTLYSINYGKVSSMNVDPIEKKPLYHFHPGEAIFSLGSFGCNLRCLNCQNYLISQAAMGDLPLRDMAPQEVSEMAMAQGCRGVAFTYNEPTIWHEFTYDAMKIARDRGLFTVYVTNGFIQEAPLRELSEHLGAMNIDVKGFTGRFYSEVCRASLEPVLHTVALAHELGIHVELTYLIIPGENDGREEISEFSAWVANIDPDIPVHFTRFHPDYQMSDRAPTPRSTMEIAREMGVKAGLNFVYLGNINIPGGGDTTCPQCHTKVVERRGYQVLLLKVREGRCTVCGRDLNMVCSKKER
jgi:pyruvate formate lyase activating enzyme